MPDQKQRHSDVDENYFRPLLMTSSRRDSMPQDTHLGDRRCEAEFLQPTGDKRGSPQCGHIWPGSPSWTGANFSMFSHSQCSIIAFSGKEQNPQRGSLAALAKWATRHASHSLLSNKLAWNVWILTIESQGKGRWKCQCRASTKDSSPARQRLGGQGALAA